MSPKATCCLVLASLVFIVASDAQILGINDQFYERPGITASEIIAHRGFKVEELYLTTQDGYRLRIYRAWNPLIEPARRANKPPILFIHGVVEDSAVFVINSFDASPKDFSLLDLSANNSTIEELLIQDPSARSLPLLAMNCGHVVWMLNRRGAPGSQTKVGRSRLFANGHAIAFGRQEANVNNTMFLGWLWPFISLANENNTQRQSSSSSSSSFGITFGAITSALGAFFDYGNLLQQVPFSFSRDFWDYSLDEQAEYDFPQVLSYVSEQSGGSRVAIVSHSAGGGIALMALSERPELAENISSLILWAPGFSIGFGEIFEIFQPTLPILEKYMGSLPPAFTSNQIQATLGLICATELAQRTLCESIADLILGASGGKEPMKPQYINTILYPSSSHELAQNLQCARFGGMMHRYDFGSAEKNQARYNSSVPPVYDLRRVTLERMSFYAGRTDFIISEADVRFAANLLEVPHEFHLIDTTFNHQGYFYHEDTPRLAIVPTLKEIQSLSARG